MQVRRVVGGHGEVEHLVVAAADDADRARRTPPASTSYHWLTRSSVGTTTSVLRCRERMASVATYVLPAPVGSTTTPRNAVPAPRLERLALVRERLVPGGGHERERRVATRLVDGLERRARAARGRRRRSRRPARGARPRARPRRRTRASTRAPRRGRSPRCAASLPGTRGGVASAPSLQRLTSGVQRRRRAGLRFREAGSNRRPWGGWRAGASEGRPAATAPRARACRAPSPPAGRTGSSGTPPRRGAAGS